MNKHIVLDFTNDSITTRLNRAKIRSIQSQTNQSIISLAVRIFEYCAAADGDDDDDGGDENGMQRIYWTLNKSYAFVSVLRVWEIVKSVNEIPNRMWNGILQIFFRRFEHTSLHLRHPFYIFNRIGFSILDCNSMVECGIEFTWLLTNSHRIFTTKSIEREREGEKCLFDFLLPFGLRRIFEMFALKMSENGFSTKHTEAMEQCALCAFDDALHCPYCS